MNLVFLISGAIVCGIIYIAIFGYAISEILKIYAKRSFSKKRYLWRFALAGIFAFAAYCGVFTVSQFVDKPQIAEFVRSSNNTIFGFLLAALIAQFLSSLFSRQNYAYQSRLSNNNAKADRIEANIKELNNSMGGLSLAIGNLLNFYMKIEIQAQNTNKGQENNKGIKRIALPDELKEEAMDKRTKLMAEYENLQIIISAIAADFNALNLTPLIAGLTTIANNFGSTIAQLTNGGSFDLSRWQQTSNYITSYRDTIFTILLTLANAARAGVEIPCPSEKQLDTFVKYKTELANWFKEVKKYYPA